MTHQNCKCKCVQEPIPQDSEVVLLDPFVCVAHKGHPLVFQVPPAIEKVVDGAVEAEKHGVDGQVTPLCVQPPVAGEGHRVGPPPVRRGGRVDPQSRHLKAGFYF